mgnify:CR=1 FL=1
MSRGHHHILGKLTSFKKSLQQAKTYYNICVPLVFQQVSTTASTTDTATSTTTTATTSAATTTTTNSYL